MRKLSDLIHHLSRRLGIISEADSREASEERVNGPARVAPEEPVERPALHLLPPGVFGVAFALNAVGAVGADASMLLAVVVVGTIGSELVAILLPSRSAGE